jgi:endonuclease III
MSLVQVVTAMEHGQREIAKILTERGKTALQQPRQEIQFVTTEADKLQNNIEEFPHAFVLGCIMDRQTSAETAWGIPYKVCQEIGGFEFSRLLSLSLERLKHMFMANRFHRFNDVMSRNFYSGIQKIHEDYSDNASNIWIGTPSSATVVRRFLEFNGVGIKIATMAANMLARDFKIPMKDYSSIDISPDVHIRTVLARMGFIPKNAKYELVAYRARELNPEYPGIIDGPLWEIGTQWCKKRNPLCGECYVKEHCPKRI